MNPDYIERLRALLSSQAESKTIIERIIPGSIKHNNKMIEVNVTGGLENGSLTEKTIFNVPVYDCGCKSEGRSNLGGIDYKGNIVCVKHFFRCGRCHRPLSILTVKPKNGRCYCGWCSVMRTIFPKR